MQDKYKLKFLIHYIITKPKKAFLYLRFIVQNFILMSIVRFRSIVLPQQNGMVTIITPTYKRLDKLKEAISSVLNQSYSHWEHIIVSDGYDQKVKDYIESTGDPRIKYYSTFKLNIWGNYQRNYALKHANGEYVLYLDDDNILFADGLKNMVEAFSPNEIGYVIAPIIYGNDMMNPDLDFMHGEIDLLNFMIKRNLVEKVGGQNMHNSADYFLISEIKKISKGKKIDVVIGHHR